MDYKKLGLRVGLEIHQQLNSGTKLFCRCPIKKSERQNEVAEQLRSAFPIEVRRKMRPVQSELGEEDPAALFEYLRDKTFVYLANPESSCLIELDEHPPLPMNENALKTSVQLAKLLHAELVDEIHVMRKTVIDGSAVTGFQRTALVATNGYIKTSFGQLGIQTINLEEDSAPAVSKENVIEYRLDRLGIPLVEIATASTISSPQEAKEAAEKIGLLLRSLDVVRGIGSIRQDINISIEGGARIEIKGFQELEAIPKLVENEVARQLSLLEIKEELHRRGFRGLRPIAKDVTKLFEKTKNNFVHRAIESGHHVFALAVPRFAGLLKKECGDRTFGKELAAYAEAYGFGIIHSDEDLEKYKLSMEFDALRKELSAGEDLLLIVVGNGAEKAINALVERVNHCIVGVPEETRTADEVGSKYARPLPGSGRLYPESDVPAISMKKFVGIEVPKTLEEYYTETITKLKKHGMSETVAKALIKYKNLRGDQQLIIDRLVDSFPNLDATKIARTVIEIPKEIKSRFNIDNTEKLTEDVYAKVISALNDGKIVEDSIIHILVDYLKGEQIDASIQKFRILSDSELEKIIQETVEANEGKKESVIMGIIMSKVRGRVEGNKVAKLLKEIL